MLGLWGNHPRAVGAQSNTGIGDIKWRLKGSVGLGKGASRRGMPACAKALRQGEAKWPGIWRGVRQDEDGGR